MNALDKLIKEYRPSMDAEVLHSWAADVVSAMTSSPEGRQEAAVLDAKALEAAIATHDHILALPASYADRALIAEIIRAYLSALPAKPAVRPIADRGEEADKYCEARGPRWAAAFNALRDYRMSNMADEDGFAGYPFVDLVSRDGAGVSIADGEFEIVSIIDEIMAAVDAHQTPAKPAVEVVEALKRAKKALSRIEAIANDRSEKAWFRLESIADEAHFAIIDTTLQAPATPDARTEVEK